MIDTDTKNEVEITKKFLEKRIELNCPLQVFNVRCRIWGRKIIPDSVFVRKG